jgi:hypothetical protein
MSAETGLRPAQPANTLAVTHGAYAVLALTPRAEIAASIRPLVPRSVSATSRRCRRSAWAMVGFADRQTQ